MESIGRLLHYLRSWVMPVRHKERALDEIYEFQGSASDLYEYVYYWYPQFAEDVDIKTAMICARGQVIRYFPCFKQMKTFVLEAVKSDGLALQYLPKFQNDWDVVYAAIRENGFAYKYIDDAMRHDVDIMCEALESSPQIINQMPLLKSEYEQILEAVDALEKHPKLESIESYDTMIQKLATAVYKHHHQEEEDEHYT